MDEKRNPGAAEHTVFGVSSDKLHGKHTLSAELQLRQNEYTDSYTESLYNEFEKQLKDVSDKTDLNFDVERVRESLSKGVLSEQIERKPDECKPSKHDLALLTFFIFETKGISLE